MAKSIRRIDKLTFSEIFKKVESRTVIKVLVAVVGAIVVVAGLSYRFGKSVATTAKDSTNALNATNSKFTGVTITSSHDTAVGIVVGDSNKISISK